ncbi:uncharacterized protein LOC130511929 [Raphanus sativus]|uniref:Uncharacterized protein LOC130511929 n=1 Tax=Raphanus sativus TaxID=3726 RepID=A0A9W3DPE9_RAPSA|nr:uncharacterized protein LOC130511929 [Raphanus sativus]
MASPQRNYLDQYENPYYLHSSDHAGLVLVSDRLTSGSEFHSWRRSVRMALNVRNKLGFIDGTIPKPLDDHRDAGSWSRCNDMVATWLLNSVSKQIGQSLLFMSTAESIWKNILSRFKQDDAPRVYEIEQQLSRLQQGSLDVSAYYTSLVTLWEEHKNYVDLPVCTCGKCECNAAQLWERLQQRSRVTKFLMGLNESFEPTRRHILMLKPIPCIEDVFNLVAQDERQKSIKPTTTPATVVFQTSGPPAAPNDASLDHNAFAAAHSHSGYRPKQRPQCTYCGQLGHIVGKCFKLHGYPPGHRNYRPSVPTQAPGTDYAPRGHQPLHQRPPPQSQPSHAQHNQQTNAVAHVTAGVANSVPATGQLDNTQIQHLIQQLQAYVNPSTSAQPQQLSTVNEKGYMAPQSTSVSLPNGITENISHIGTVHLSSALVLHNVLHESTQDSMIGRGSLLHNLYILCFTMERLGVKVKEPLSNDILGYRLLGMPPPSSGGAAMVLVFRALSVFTD